MRAEVRNLKIYEETNYSAMLMHLLWFFASIFFQVCSTIDKISVTQPLQDPNFIVSSGGTFKLGFFSPENTTNRYVGILYNVPKLEAVWVANRDKPLNDSSGVFTVSEDGNLVILIGNRVKLWSSNVSSPMPNSTAQLMENGNLVLRDGSNGRSVWESFEHPTDSFLAGMRIGGSGNGTIQLSSWRSPSDPSTGSFMFGLNSKQIPEVYLLKRGVLFWRSGPWDGRVFIGAPGQRSPLYGSRLNVVTDNARETYLTYGNSNASILPHIKIIESGDLQEVALSDEGDWVLAYLKERTECDVYGICGPNGICDPKGSPICSCLQGFEPRGKEEWTKGNWTAGCSRKSLLQCDRNNSVGQQGEGDSYLMHRMVKIPDFYSIISTPECSNSCLEDCSCSAYTFVVGIGCMHWARDSLIDVQQFSIRGSDLYIRVAHSELDHARSNKGNKAIVSTAVSVGFLFLATSLFIFWKCWNKYRGKLCKTTFMLNDSSENSKLAELQLYTYHTLAIATDNFHATNKLGQGGFGPVFMGQLLNGEEIAVKKLSNSSSQGMKEFMNEVTLISKLQHCNLVRLLGSCVERGEKLLVYEFLPNKSLDTYIFDLQKKDLLDWNRRCLIIEGIGRGLLYLHRDSRLKIIHRDLKASNILLDEELNPKISDFGLARIFGGKQDQANTNRVVGTYGYMAPEYALKGKFSDKSDVYSFGVLLLEIVSGRRNTSFYLDEDNLSLLGYAWKMWKENEAANLAFTQQLDTAIEMEIRRCVQVGLLCVQDNPNDRPNMSNVLLMLNSEMTDIPLPKYPVYTSTFLVSDVRCNPQSRPSNNGISLTELQGR